MDEVVQLEDFLVPHAILESFASIAASTNEMTLLREAELSRRFLLLRLLEKTFEHRYDKPGAAFPFQNDLFGASLQMLSEAYDHSPHDIERLLLYPQVGMWMAYTVRRFRQSRIAHTPLWAHVGQLQSLAVVAAVRTGLPFKTTVPVWRGKVRLPMLGFLRVATPNAWDIAEVECFDGSIRVTCQGVSVEVSTSVLQLDRAAATEQPIAWTPHVSLLLTSGSKSLTVELDDIDPYRESFAARSSPANSLDTKEIEQWQALLQDAWALLVRDHPLQATELAGGFLSLTPTPAEGRFRPRSSTSSDAFGGITASLPENAVELACTLVHEMQHSKLNGLMRLTPLTEDCKALFHAPWRDDPRPLNGLLHGVYSFSAVTEFWNVRRHVDTGRAADLAHFEFALWRQQTRNCVEKLSERTELTTNGRRFVDGLVARSKNIQNETVPSSVLSSVDDTALDHYLAWRVHHVQPSSGDLQQLRDLSRFQSSTDQTKEDVIITDPKACGLDARGVLIRIRLVDPDAFEALCHQPELISKHIFGATPADLAYVAGDIATASHHYLEELANSDHIANSRGQIWAGIALTSNNQNIRQYPEVFKAVAVELANRDEIASFLGFP